jgi:hypothetical protein
MVWLKPGSLEFQKGRSCTKKCVKKFGNKFDLQIYSAVDIPVGVVDVFDLVSHLSQDKKTN